MIPRKSASRQSPKTSVRRPSASRIALNGVSAFARTMRRRRPARGGLPRLAARREARRRLRLGQARRHRTRLTPLRLRRPSLGRVDLAVRLRPRGDLLLALDRLGRDREQLAEALEPHPLGALVEELLLDLGREVEAAGDRERELGRLGGRRLDVGRGQLDEPREQGRAPARCRPARRVVLVVDRLDAAGRERSRPRSARAAGTARRPRRRCSAGRPRTARHLGDGRQRPDLRGGRPRRRRRCRTARPSSRLSPISSR